MTARRYSINSRRWPGVYGYDSNKKKIRGKPDICYYINFRLDGKLVWEKVGWKSEGYSPEVAAELRANRIKTKRHGKQVKTSKEIRRESQRTNKTIAELKKEYFNSERGLALKGRKTDLNRYDNHLKPCVDKKTVPSLSILDIERIKKSMRDRAPATVANSLELLRRIINYGVDRKLCPPLSFKIEFPAVDNEVTEFLTPEEAARLTNTLQSWKRKDVARMVWLVMLTGMRRGEAFGLKRDDLDFNHNLIHLEDPKGGKNTTVPMSPPVREILEEQISFIDEQKTKRKKRYKNTKRRVPVWRDRGYVFPGVKGGMRKDCSAIDRIKVEADLPKSFRGFHGLRHHLAVTLASSGKFNLDMIGELLTHKSHEMTRRYAKFLPDAKKRASDQAAELLKEHASGNMDDKIIPIKSV